MKIKNRLTFLATLSPLLLIQSLAFCSIRAVASVEKPTYFIGENIHLHYVLENTGTTTIRFESGGDYRGSSRSSRFDVRVYDSKNVRQADPDPFPSNWGGLMGGGEILPGEKADVTRRGINLFRYCMIERPGTYRITIQHDLGWKKGGPLAEVTVTLLEPTEGDTRQILEHYKTLPNPDDIRSLLSEEPTPDWQTLRHPAYLKPLSEWAATGSSWAVVGIGSIETPQATKELIRLLDEPASGVIAESLRELNERVPGRHMNRSDEKRYPHFKAERLRKEDKVRRSWSPKLLGELRPKLQREIQRGDVQRSAQALSVLTALVQAEDREFLVNGLNAFLQKHAAKVGWNDLGYMPVASDEAESLTIAEWHQRTLLESWKAALTAYAQKGFPIPEDPKSSAEEFLFVAALKERKTFRPRAWKDHCLTTMRSPLSAVRRDAVEICGALEPSLAKGEATRLLSDPDSDVRLVAVQQAWNLNDASLVHPLLQTLRVTIDRRYIDYAVDTAVKYGKRYEALEILVSRLDTEEIPLRHDLLTNLIENIWGKYPYGSSIRNNGDIAKYKPAWVAFLKTHEKELRAGHVVKDLPAELLPPDWTMDPIPVWHPIEQ